MFQPPAALVDRPGGGVPDSPAVVAKARVEQFHRLVMQAALVALELQQVIAAFVDDLFGDAFLAARGYNELRAQLEFPMIWPTYALLFAALAGSLASPPAVLVIARRLRACMKTWHGHLGHAFDGHPARPAGRRRKARRALQLPGNMPVPRKRMVSMMRPSKVDGTKKQGDSSTQRIELHPQNGPPSVFLAVLREASSIHVLGGSAPCVDRKRQTPPAPRTGVETVARFAVKQGAYV